MNVVLPLYSFQQLRLLVKTDMWLVPFNVFTDFMIYVPKQRQKTFAQKLLARVFSRLSFLECVTRPCNLNNGGVA